MNGYFNYKDELYHHGVIGMKWGVRRYQKYGEGGYTPKSKDIKKSEYKQAKKEFKQESKEFKNLKRDFYKSKDKTEEKFKVLEEKASDREKKRFEVLEKKADIKGTDKSRYKVFRNEMLRLGVPGSIADYGNFKAGTMLYDNISTKYGKKYAEKITSSAKNINLAESTTLAPISLGLSIVGLIFGF